MKGRKEMVLNEGEREGGKEKEEGSDIRHWEDGKWWRKGIKRGDEK